MARYHLDTETGNAGLCRAEKGKCPFGEVNHYGSPLEAMSAYEDSHSGSFLKKSSSMSRKMLAIGGIAVAAVSLAGCTSIGVDHSSNQPQNPTPVSSPGDDSTWLDQHDSSESTYPQESGPSEEEINDWLNEKQQELIDWLNENGYEYSDGDYGDSGDNSGISFQGRSLDVTPQEIAEAEATLANLVVRPESTEPYDRAENFGRSFKTGVAGAVEHRDVPDAVFKNDSPQARVVDGYFIDPYTGQQVHVIGGESYDADIDHIVPLKEAWDSGANTWTQDQRVAYSNDLDNLVYTASGVNRSKGDQDMATWIPSFEPSQCLYAIRTIEIKGTWNLSVDSAEKAAMREIIDTKCYA